ncbi:hypothetical protein CYPRO_2322 [Cyclonatronum proteinivorum]|uniref:Uncharacterized protein n=1 Tax=Cyclonatronum proteinivorum TaxID=1457365 RepID=A0A345UM66_9BACT|nr:hypothetical protein [Cyclonatronum proteinivorum]AXJ01568.1 hypothetical protein CYPRO_2322 [Cyclonatronum proteinivorum]
MNLIENFKSRLSKLAQQFHASSEDDEGDYPSDSELIILEYCEQMGYKADHIPAEFTLYDPDDPEDIYHENLSWHINELSLMHDDVFELDWFYSHLFWPDIFKTPEDFRSMNESFRSEYGL